MVALGAILILSSFVGCGAASKETIVLGELPWDTAMVGNQIVVFILEHGYGYDTEIVPGQTIPLWQGLKQGDLDLQMEVFPNAQLTAYNEAMAEGSVVKLGESYFTTQGWYVPTYMIEDGLLPEGFSTEDMPDYWELFKDPEDQTKGILYSGVPGWEAEKTTTIKFETLGLDEYYNMLPIGSDAALIASMASACEQGKAWLGYYWSPTWVLGVYDMTRITEPIPYDVDLWEPDRACDWSVDISETAANAEWLETADPEIVSFLQKFTTSNEVCNAYMLHMHETGDEAEDTAIWFLEEYESIWTQWVSADVASKVKAALP
jgi:glycine betaine/proline transport system substrate-binding protein